MEKVLEGVKPGDAVALMRACSEIEDGWELAVTHKCIAKIRVPKVQPVPVVEGEVEK